VTVDLTEEPNNSNMIKRAYIRIIIFLVLLLPASLFSQVQLYTSIDTSRGFVGDLFHLRLETEHPRGFVVQYPDTLETLGDFIVRDVTIDRENRSTSVIYTITVYDTGRYNIPSIPVTAESPEQDDEPIELESSEIAINILSIVPPDAQDLKDIKPLMRIPPRIPWLWILLGLVGIAVAFYLWRRFLSDEHEQEPEISPEQRRLNAHEIALSRLADIREADYPAKGAMKQHFSEISETLREYFENRYFIPALEMTTSEVIEQLPSHVSDELVGKKIEGLLQLSDLVKFAKYFPTQEEANGLLADAFEIISETKFTLTETTSVESEEEYVNSEQ